MGTLVAVRFEGDEDGTEVIPSVLGVCPEGGLVQSETRAQFYAGEYMRPPDVDPRPVDRLWYRRSRAEYPGSNLWFHDLDTCEAFSHKSLGGVEVVLVGPDVERCDGTRDFLCG